jgi:RNA polymerase sigma-70 factor (ECF subfamily)
MSNDTRKDQGSEGVSPIEDARKHRQIAAWSRLHGDYLRGLAIRLCRTQLDPDDLVQDLFTKALVTTMPDGANERAWLARVLHNLFIDKLRRLQARREDLIEDVREVPAAEDDRVWWERLSEDAVRREVANLPDDQRVTFELFAFRGRSYDQIAAELGIAKATVGTRILRARKRLRDALTRKDRDG